VRNGAAMTATLKTAAPLPLAALHSSTIPRRLRRSALLLRRTRRKDRSDINFEDR
jgi:hypothetical protein